MTSLDQLKAIALRHSTLLVLAALAAGYFGLYHTKPTPEWEVTKDVRTDAVVPNDVATTQPATVYKAVPLDSVKVNELLKNVAAVIAGVLALIATLKGQQEVPAKPAPPTPTPTETPKGPTTP